MIRGISKALIFLFGKNYFFPRCQGSRDIVSSLHPVVIENQVETKSLENNSEAGGVGESYHIFLLPESQASHLVFGDTKILHGSAILIKRLTAEAKSHSRRWSVVSGS